MAVAGGAAARDDPDDNHPKQETFHGSLLFRRMQGCDGARKVRRVAHDLPVVQDDCPAGVPRHVLIVRYKNDRNPVFLVELPKQIHQFPAGVRVDVPRRLVGQQDRRLIGQGAGDGHALLLTPGKLRRMVIQTRFQAHLLQQSPRAIPPLGAPESPAVQQRQFHVLQGGGPREQIEILKHETDLPIPQPGTLVARHLHDFFAFQQIAAAGRVVETSERIHERRFPGA